jgi:hypothetical protein
VVVSLAFAVVEVELSDAGRKEFECLVDAFVIFWRAYIEADADAVEADDFDDFEEMHRGGPTPSPLCSIRRAMRANAILSTSMIWWKAWFLLWITLRRDSRVTLPLENVSFSELL